MSKASIIFRFGVCVLFIFCLFFTHCASCLFTGECLWLRWRCVLPPLARSSPPPPPATRPNMVSEVDRFNFCPRSRTFHNRRLNDSEPRLALMGEIPPPSLAASGPIRNAPNQLVLWVRYASAAYLLDLMEGTWYSSLTANKAAA